MTHSLENPCLDNPRTPVVHVVDDDDAVRDSTRALLESHGFEVRDYASGGEFLRRMAPPACGCVLLDVHMPEMGGLELLDALRARGFRLPVIAVSGRSDLVLKERCVRRGAITLLDKPVSHEVLLSSLAGALSGAKRGLSGTT